MKYRIVESEIEPYESIDGTERPAYPVWTVQSFRNGAWDVDMRTWNPNSCGYFRDYREALRRFNEIVYPKPLKVLIEVEV